MSARLLLAALAGSAALVVALPAAAVGLKSFTDPAGDAGAAPDVGGIVVANLSDGTIGFSFTFANRAGPLEGQDWLELAIDADRNARTGSPDGSEYVIVVDAAEQQVALGLWTGAEFDWDVPQESVATDGRTVLVNRSELAGTMSFDFFAYTGVGEEEGGDVAPDGEAVYTYTLDLRPRIDAINATFAPKQPVAGKAFAGAARTIVIDTGLKVKPGAVTCTAKLAGKVLKPTARCRWQLPRNAKGKRLVVTVTVTYKGVKAVSKPFAFKVR